MKHKITYSILLLTILLASALAIGQESLQAQPKKPRTPDDYKVRTLKEIAALGVDIARERDDERKGDADTLVHGDLVPSRVRVTYKGTARPLPRKKKDVISQWSYNYAGNPEHYIGPYKTDVLFSEGGVNHWLVVNQNVLADLKRQVKRGRAVDVYLIRLGAYKLRNNWTWVLLVESFAPK